MMISIVIPVYNGARTISPLVRKVIATLEKDPLQVVLVNDGSVDDSHEQCLNLAGQFPGQVTYVNLSRNFGEHNAVMAGLSHARGDYVVIMDDDFQNPPEEVTALVERAKEGGFDVVYSYYEKKRHSRFRNMGSSFHNAMATYLLKKPRDLYLSSFKCLNRFVVDEVVKYKGPYPYLDGLVLRCTRSIGTVKVRHESRMEGASGYTLKKLLRLWLNMFLNFSILPLRMSSLMGLALSTLGAFIGIFVIIEKIVHPEVPMGWPSIIVLMTTFSGVQLLILGLLGEYVGTMFLGQNQTPQYIVREIHEGKEPEDS